MKRIISYAGVILVVLFGAVLFGFGRRKTKEHKKHNQVLAQDEMTLPSQSQRLMKLADTLSYEQRDTLFQHHDLSGLFQSSESAAQNGFFGPHEQRLEVVFKEVHQDEASRGTFHVHGLMRVKEEVSTITGKIELRQTRNFTDNRDGVYIATGLFHFQQHTLQNKLIAHLDGIAALDFEIRSNKVHFFIEEETVRPRTRHFAFEGNWADVITKEKQRVLWADEFGPVANAVLGDFDIGGRMATVNPKYRKYGWPEYFQNEEWWADSPKPKLSL